MAVKIRSVKPTVNKDKPCRCGSGYYCHRHLQYGVKADKSDGYQMPKCKVSESFMYDRLRNGGRGMG